MLIHHFTLRVIQILILYIYEAKKCKLDSIDNARMNDLIYIDGMNLNEYRETHNEKQNQT